MEKKNRRPTRIITAVLCIVMIMGLSSCAADAAAVNNPAQASQMNDKPESRTGKKIYFA